LSKPKIDIEAYASALPAEALRYVRELEHENLNLHELVGRLEAEKGLSQAIVTDASKQFHDLERQLARERERRDLFESQLERQLTRLSGLYVAAQRLNDARDRSEVLGVISEVIVNLVGSEEFGVFELTPGHDVLTLLSSMGIEAPRFRAVSLDSGSIGRVVQSGQTYVGEGGASSIAQDEDGLTACFPLKVPGRVMGAVAIFGLLPQKLALEPFDREIFELLGTQAARALLLTESASHRKAGGALDA